MKNKKGRLFSHSIKLNICYENVGSLLKIISSHNCNEEKTGLKYVAKPLNILLCIIFTT